MNINELCKQIKTRISVEEIAQECGMPIQKIGDRCASPFHNGSNPTSFVYYDEGKWYSHSDQVGGDQIDLLALLKYNGNKGKAIFALAHRLGLETGESKPIEQYDILDKKIRLYNQQLPQEQRDYIHNRNITDETISSHLLGWDGEGIIIPCIRYGHVCYWARRNASGSPKYFKMPLNNDGIGENELFGLQTLKHQSDTLIIAEGAFDYLSFYQEGYEVISGIGRIKDAHFSKVTEIAQKYKRVILTYDRDDRTKTGQRFDHDVFTRTLEGKHQNVYVLEIPSSVVDAVTGEVFPCKDVSDWYTHVRELSKLLSDNIIDAYLWKAKQFTDIEEFNRWITPLCVKYPSYKIEELFSGIDQFDTESLKHIKKACLNTPKDVTIASLVLKRHNLIHVPGLGFFEYMNGYWNALHDDTVQGYVGSELGKWNTNAKAKSVVGVIKAMPSVSKPNLEFNRKPCINFRNGTLDIKKIDIWNHEPLNDVRPPSPDDYITFKLSYDYDPNARCPRWEKFIQEITDTTGSDLVSDENNDDYLVLQQFAGYILYPDNRLGTALVLEGNKSNGKSVFVNTLAKLFKDNGNHPSLSSVTSVSVDSLARPFNAIHLANSVLNINSELRSDIQGAEAVFKQAVTGDQITDSFKGKDSFSFSTRAKFIISLNKPIRSSDLDDGFYRRLHIVEFPIYFTTNPTRPNERRADVNLERTLTTPEALSGIFNWAYIGYQMLWHNDYRFYTSQRSEQLKQNLERYNDPILDWLLDYDLTEPVTAKHLWNQFSIYCESANIRKTPTEPFFYRHVGECVKNGKVPWTSKRQGKDNVRWFLPLRKNGDR